MANPLNHQFAGAYDPQIVADYIRQAAIARGMDPDIALRVAKSEGLFAYRGDQGSSFGPFQLHYGGVAPGGNKVGGLGDVFTARTGLDARDPRTWAKQVDFSLDEAKRGGWGPWHGWKGDKWAGIKGSAPIVATDRFEPQGAAQLPPGMLSPVPVAEQRPVMPPMPYQPQRQQQPQQLTPEHFFEERHLEQPVEQQSVPMQQAPMQQAVPVRQAPSPEDFFEGKTAPRREPMQVEHPYVQQQEPEWGAGREFMRGMVSGATGGLGDMTRAGATVRAGYEALTGNAPEGFFQHRRNIIAQQEAARQRYEQEAPGTSGVATALGAGVGTMLPIGAGARVLGAGARALGAAVPRLAPALERGGALLSGEGGWASRLAHGGAYGAGSELLSQGVTPEESRGPHSVLYGGLTGATTNLALGGIAGPLAKTFTAHVPEPLKKLANMARDKYGIDVHVAQVAPDEEVRKLYKNLVPQEVQTKQIHQWNAKVAEELGMKDKPLSAKEIGDKMSDVGHEIASLSRRVTAAPDNRFFARLRLKERELVNSVPVGDPVLRDVQRFASELFNDINPNGTIDGKVLHNYIRKQGKIDRLFPAGNAADPLSRNTNKFLKEEMMDLIKRSNPRVGQQFQEARQAYKKLAAVDDLVNGSELGFINPGALQKAVTKRQIGGSMKELADIGKHLPSMGPSGGATSGGKTMDWSSIGLMGASAAKPALAAMGLGIPYGDLVSYASGAALARNLLQSRLLQSSMLNNMFLSERVPAQQILRAGGDIVRGTSGAYGGGVGGKEKQK